MKMYLIILFLSTTSIQIFAQRNIDVDIFGNLQYVSENGRHKAFLKKDIFESLIYSDNYNNEVTYTKKYLDREYRGLLGNKDAEIDFFRHLIRQYRSESKYKAMYSVDIFGKTIFEDNRNNKLETGKDIFGNPTYEEKRNGITTSIKRDLSGGLEYRSGNDRASLKKDIFGKWCYSDSSGNKFEFGDRAWSRLEERFGNDEKVFFFLINEFLR